MLEVKYGKKIWGMKFFWVEIDVVFVILCDGNIVNDKLILLMLYILEDFVKIVILFFMGFKNMYKNCVFEVFYIIIFIVGWYVVYVIKSSFLFF